MCGTCKLLDKCEPLQSSSASVISVFITVHLILDKQSMMTGFLVVENSVLNQIDCQCCHLYSLVQKIL